MEKDPFKYFKFQVSDNATLQGTVNSTYNLFMAIGVVGLLLTLILIGLKLMSSNPSKRAEALEEMKWKALIAIILFGMTTLISTILSIVSTFA